ncbi:MAG: hypothetical protein KJZ75_06500 [Hyphomonadaceae bacterium]|nr:hypothetical protein [Hyphomonadaceae bacterium]
MSTTAGSRRIRREAICARSRKHGGRCRKWVASRSLKEVGPNATLVGDDFEAAIRKLKAEVDGEIEVGGPKLAASLGKLGLIDEYHLSFTTWCSGRATRSSPECGPRYG